MSVTDDPSPALRPIHVFVDEHRATCLWYLREDYYPRTVEEALRTLDAIARHGDLSAFKKAAELKQWLSRNSSSPSAV